jgi:hypothetical protein
MRIVSMLFLQCFAQPPKKMEFRSLCPLGFSALVRYVSVQKLSVRKKIEEKKMGDAVLFHNGIGSFVLTTPFLQNLDEPEIYIPGDDQRVEPITSISQWPVHDFSCVAPVVRKHARVFVLWGWPKEIRISGDNVIYQKMPDWPAGMHESDSYLALVKEPKKFSTIIKTQRRLRLCLGKEERLIALFNGSNPRPNHKQWPVEHLVTLAQKLVADQKTQLLFLGGEGERAMGEQLIKAVQHQCWNLAGELPLAQSAEVLTQCSFAIGNDSALMHVADAVGCKGAALFGPTLWSKNSPTNGMFKQIQSKSGGCTDFNRFQKPAQWKCKESKCMETILPDQVMEVVANEF